MIIVAVVSTALFSALAVAGLVGQMPSLRRGRNPEVTRLRRLSDLATRAGCRHAAGPIVAASIGMGIIVGVVVVAVTPVATLALVPAAISAATPTVVLKRRAHVRVTALRRAWPDALAQISGNLRAGRPLSHALIDLSLNGPPALLGPLTGLAARIQTVGLIAALQAVRDAVAEPVTDRIIEVLVLAHTEGGRIVLTVIDDLTAAVTEEVAACEETETLALEGKLNARLVFALPWLVLVMLTAKSGPFQSFYTSPAGAVVIVIGAVISAVGMALVATFSAVPAEPRVLVQGREAR